MTTKKRTEEKTGRIRIEDSKASVRELTDKQKEQIKGGAIPAPAGPVPIPYPNTRKD